MAESLSALWTSDAIAGNIDAGPYVAGDRIVLASRGSVFAFDMYDGSRVAPSAGGTGFPYTFTSQYGGAPFFTAAGGFLYFADGSAIVALRLGDGTPSTTWKSPNVESIVALSASNGRLFVTALDGSGATVVSGYDAVSGNARFGPVKIADASPGAITVTDKAAFFTASGTARAVNVDFGDVRWSASPPQGAAFDPGFAPSVGADVAVFATTSLVAYDLVKGTLRWQVAPSAGASGSWLTPAVDAAGTVAYAVHSGGDVVAITLADGTVQWRQHLDAPSSPVAGGGFLYVPCANGTNVAKLSCADGTVDAEYGVPNLASNATPIVGDGMIVLPAADGTLVGLGLDDVESAAHFDGANGRIDVVPDGNHFDFGTNAFTVEAWFRTSSGGEIVSSAPTNGDATQHGFRLNVSPLGEVRVAVTDKNEIAPNAGKTAPTSACDGTWHHVALLRAGGAFKVFLDGLSLTVYEPEDKTPPKSIGGTSALCIGAYVGGGAPQANFAGLMREVRIWDRALDAATVAGNAKTELIGREPHLLGLWALDETQNAQTPVEPRNKAAGHRTTATFTAASSRPTSLGMDDSAYPYLIHEVKTQWPYAGTWGARGTQPIAGAPAVSSATVAFSTNNAIYGVHAGDGKRLWTIHAAEGCSAPVADGARFLAMTGDESVVSIDAATGTHTQIPAFTSLASANAAFYAAPACSADAIAAAAPNGQLAIVPRASGGTPVQVKIAGTPRSLTFGPASLIVASGDAATTLTTLTALDPATGATHATLAVTSPAFAVTRSWLVCVQADGLKRYDISAALPAVAASAPIPSGMTITGLAAWPDLDLLVVSTAQGVVFGCSLAKLAVIWQTPLPGNASAAGVHAAAFDVNGRVVCASGTTLAVLEPDAGTLIGLYSAAQPFLTTPVVASGTAYAGCVDPAGENDAVDGALHSIVVGETLALRLGVDVDGTPLATPAAYAEVQATTADATLHLLNPAQSCVEAWINVPPPSSGTRVGGGILAICPTGAPDAFDLRIAVTPDGLDYIAHGHEAAGWTGVHATTPAAICDGTWHHLAFSRTAEGTVLIYVDAQPQTVTDVALPAVAAPPAHTGDGVTAYVGASAADDLSPVQPFVGMIGEVRVWDSYVTAPEISDRMHVKLRGNEPDLLAYWNFDRIGADDAARQGNDAVVQNAGSEPTMWLADLPFTSPSYPYVESAATIVSDSADASSAAAAGTAASGTAAASGTTYKLTITLRKADGTPLPDTAATLWYVRHDDDEPAAVTIDGTAVNGVAPAHDDAGAFTRTSGAAGTIVLNVVTPLTAHGPTIDVRAAFMTSNERFHVNTLLDKQKLAKPVPPSLVAQTKLIQDYHYQPGNAIDETRDRSTHRVVLTAINPDHTIRPNEPITLWASGPLDVEVSGSTYHLTTDNSADFTMSPTGELVVVIEAQSLTSPSLFARAGFMQRNDRMTIAPDDDAHQQLATLSGSALSQPKMVNYKPNATAADTKPLLSSDYAPHADDVASSVRQVMASVKPPPKPAVVDAAAPPPAALRAGNGAAGAGAAPPAAPPAPAFGDMQQPKPVPRADTATVLRAMPGRPRFRPLDMPSSRRALQGNIGFMIGKDAANGTFAVRPLKTQADLTAALPAGASSVQPIDLQMFGLGDLWNSIKTAAVDLYHDAVSIAVSITNKITVWIHELQDEVSKLTAIVVDSVEKAVDLVAGFFKNLGLEIWMFILYLRALFDWGAILEAHRFIRKLILAVTAELGRTTGPMDAAIRSLLSADGAKTQATGSGTAQQSAPSGSDDASLAQANGVHAKSSYHQLQDNANGASIRGPGIASSADSALDAIESVGRDLADMAGDLVTMNFSDLSATFMKMIASLETAFKDGIAALLTSAYDELIGMLTGLIKLLDTPISIPFFSALYKWLTGSELSVLDLMCLVIAVPVHIVYFLVCEGKRTFAQASRNWPLPDGASSAASSSSGAGARPAVVAASAPAPKLVLKEAAAPQRMVATTDTPTTDTPTTDTSTTDTSKTYAPVSSYIPSTGDVDIVGFYAVAMIISGSCSALLEATYKPTPDPGTLAARGIFQVLQTLTSIPATWTTLVYTMMPYNHVLIDRGFEENDVWFQTRMYGVASASTIVDAITLATGIANLAGLGSAGPSSARVQQLKNVAALGAMFIGIFGTNFQLTLFASSKEYREDSMAQYHAVAELFGVQTLMTVLRIGMTPFYLVPLFDPMMSNVYAMEGIAAARSLLLTAAIITHVVAASELHSMP